MIKFRTIKRYLKNYSKLIKLLYRDKRTPRISKVFLWIAIVYAISPIDLIPDFIPLVGYVDDIIIIPALMWIAIRFIPKEVYRENYRKVFIK